MLDRLVATADVFMTNTLPDSRRKLRIDVEDIRRVRPTSCTSGPTRSGAWAPRRASPASTSASSGVGGASATPSRGRDAERPVTPRPGFGDRTGSLSAAFGVTAALFRRATTGEGAVVDVSLLATALWVNASDLVYSQGVGADFSRQARGPSPHVRTADDRWITLTLPNAGDAAIAALWRALGQPEVVEDERYATGAARAADRASYAEALDAAFARFTLAELRQRLAPVPVSWEVVQTPMEVLEDPQVLANGYLTTVGEPGDEPATVVRAPVEFDEERAELRPAPALGQQSDEVLAELGYDPGAVAALRADGVVG